MDQEALVQEKYKKIKDYFNERNKRLWAASEALSIGYGGVSIVHKATGLSRPTIHAGIKELEQGTTVKEDERVRKSGGGRSLLEALEGEHSQLLTKLKELVEDSTRGDPMKPLLWTCKSTRNLSNTLRKQGIEVSAPTVARLLNDLGYSLQSNRKSLEPKQSADRNSQFEYINELVLRFQTKKQPIISIDTKKKELIGDFKNSGQEWRPRGQPKKVNVHDFESGKSQVKAIPYGIYDVTWNRGWVNIGVDHDTAEFAVESIRKWWLKMGQQYYPEAKELLITADGGGSNSSRGRLWKVELQTLANEFNLEITVCHLPPGTSKWNKIEHRLFCHITKNWRARPLTSYEVVVNLIGSTTTKTGLKVVAELDVNEYELKKKTSDEEMEALNLHRHVVNSQWNYTIKPL
jgi:transposase